MRSLLMILLFNTCSLMAIGQAEYVFHIKDQNGNALPFVHLQVENTLKGAVADADGIASIRLSDAYLNYPLLISHVGYETKILQFETLSTKQINDVILVPSEKELDNINVIDIGISPNDFMKMVAENLEANFYGKSYEALGYYEQETFENKTLSLEIEAELLLEAEGLNKMFGRNRYIKNDNVYPVKILKSDGEQQFNVTYKLIQSARPDEDNDFRVDSYVDAVLTEKAALEREFIFNPIDRWEKITWRFISLDKIGDKKYIQVRDDRSSEANNWLLEYWVDIEDFKIRQINAIWKRDLTSIKPRSTDGLPKRLAKKIEKLRKDAPKEKENIQLDSKTFLTLNYFEVDNLLYLKKIDFKNISNFLLGEEEVNKTHQGSFTVEELDPKISKKGLMLTKNYPELKWWAK